MSSSSNPRLPLNIVAIFSIVGCVIGIFYGLCLNYIQTLSHAEVEQIVAAQGLAQGEEVVGSIFELSRIGNFYALFNVLEIVALVIILFGKRVGFHVYAAAQLGFVGLMVMIFGVVGFVTYILWCILWCYIYWVLIQNANRKEA